MNAEIDFTKGGYQGDIIEETFKPFTTAHIPFWWHFREVLRANQAIAPYWQSSDGSILPDEEQKHLIALSLLNYAVYTGISEAIAFYEQMQYELFATTIPGRRIFEVRKQWKAMYSSLYTSFNALCNIICVLVGLKSPFGDDPTRPWNFTPKDAYNLANGRGIRELAEPIERCRDRLEIRDHLDHYWTVWVSISQGKFLLDEKFKKGYVPVRPNTEVTPNVDAYKLSHEHIAEISKDFNLIYRELAVSTGHLDKYLLAKAWKIDYADYGPPHNGQRPKP